MGPEGVFCAVLSFFNWRYEMLTHMSALSLNSSIVGAIRQQVTRNDKEMGGI